MQGHSPGSLQRSNYIRHSARCRTKTKSATLRTTQSFTYRAVGEGNLFLLVLGNPIDELSVVRPFVSYELEQSLSVAEHCYMQRKFLYLYP
jgi:hypothetical protein